MQPFTHENTGKFNYHNVLKPTLEWFDKKVKCSSPNEIYIDMTNCYDIDNDKDDDEQVVSN